jgi:hypothetical protein
MPIIAEGRTHQNQHFFQHPASAVIAVEAIGPVSLSTGVRSGLIWSAG